MDPDMIVKGLSLDEFSSKISASVLHSREEFLSACFCVDNIE
jgi:hypothetical protein